MVDRQEGRVPRRPRRPETTVQRQHRLTRQAEVNSRRRSHTPQEDTVGESASASASVESESQRSQRLARQRLINARRLSLATPLDEAHNEVEAARSAAEDIMESPARMRERLARQRVYNQQRRPSLAARMSAHHDSEVVSVSQTLTPPESEVDRCARLARQQVKDRERRSNSVMEESNLIPPSQHTVEEIEEQLRDALGAPGLDESTCVVCDRLVLRRACKLIASSDAAFIERMREVLGVPDEGLPELLVAQYNCGDTDPSLSRLLLSSKGIRVSSSGFTLVVCSDCHASLIRDSTKPPKFAIANGFFVGYLPDHLSAATWIEKIMTQLVTVVAQTRVMRGGRHRAIRSHCMVFDATPGPPATLLPRRIDRGSSYRVVLAGPMTTGQNEQIRKLHDARGSVVAELLSFFKENNHFYASVSVDDASIGNMDSDTTLCDRIFIEHDDPDAEAAIRSEQDSVLGRFDGSTLYDGDTEEHTVIERNILLAPEEIVPDVSFAQRVVDLNPQQPAAVPRLRVDHSTRFASSVDVEAKMHSHLFPFGRGHPGESRKWPVSKRECLRHYSLLSSRRFAQDPTFMMTAFARLAIENMYTLTSVKCKRYSSIFDGYEAITSEDLTAALLNNERRQRGQRPPDLLNPLADRFLKSVELGSVSVWGSSAERRQCRQEAFGYQTRFGQPTLFVTLTPNSDNSYAMAHYAGILSVESLFDVLEARIPSRTQMRKAAMTDDCAAARLFMRTVEAFIARVIGIDPKTKRPWSRGGLFGKAKAYFGMVETQGRGTLHIHFLIWLQGAPTNATAFDEKVDQEGDAFLRGLAEYVDSIVTNKLPLAIETSRCISCHSVGTLMPLPINSASRRQRRKRGNVDQLEPELVECRECGQHSSSQHVVRQLMLQNRPPHWPPPLRPLTEDEKTSRVEKEAHARSSATLAEAVIRDRESFLAAIERGDADILEQQELSASDAARLPHCHPDDDPFKHDKMIRMIEMTPPTVDWTRMVPVHRDFMLSSLAMNLNMHWWGHTGSCFKKSRATTSASVCRYGFPRKRASATSVSGRKVTLKRGVSEEFINGYNPSIMAAFKCNHDVQFLCGGKAAINRIYYCCKYVTKPQHQIDSMTAVALASFQRRESKEVIELASEAPPTVAELQRRRVTGMVHTFTNKQEIAGPLAALYLLRGSCCYSSDVCAKLPLTDVLRQLQSDGDYTCTLVRVEEGGDGSSSPPDTMYRSASFLDDYIYRPQSCEDLNLYEFVMRCYRRQRTPSSTTRHVFCGQHPLSGSHCIGFRQKEAVPVIKGQRLPRMKEEMTEEDLENYAKIALTLFKPFRVVFDLVGRPLGTIGSWYSAYRSWEGSRSDFTRMIMHNMDDYHAGSQGEDEATLDSSEIDGSDNGGESGEESADDAYDSDDAAVAYDDCSDNQDVLDVIMGASSLQDGLRSFPTTSRFAPDIQTMLDTFKQHQLVEGIALNVAGRSRPSGPFDDRSLQTMDVGLLKKWVKDASFDSGTPADAIPEGSTQAVPVERPTTVNEMIDESLQPRQLYWVAPVSAGASSDVGIFSGVSAVSQAFTLNELQHGAFAIVATHLLHRWRCPDVQPAVNGIIPDATLQERQLLLYMGGEGGTGKSRVINAIQGLCQSWQRPGALIVTALTGKAASIISGQTLASFEMTLKSAGRHAIVQDVDCIIIDEVSMMSKDQLLRLDRLLRKSKRVLDVPFGGLFIILVGDFLQLPPVGADPLFVNPAAKLKASLVDFEGFRLWRQFQDVVILQESVRFRDDPAWGEGCSKARYGEWTPAFVEMINQRVVRQPCPATTPIVTPPANTVFVTPDNESRMAINCQFIATTAPFLPSEEFPIRVVANFKGALNNLSREDICRIMSLPDSKFGRMAPYLDLVVGMPIQISQNIRTKKGVANGTTGSLHSIHFPPGTVFSLVRDVRTGVNVHLPDQRPLYALVALNRGGGARSISEGLEPSLFPVFPDCEAYQKTTIQLTKSSSGEVRTLTLKIQQFPFVCAVGATVYKVQGESLRSMAVVDWRTSGKGANKPQQAYLMVSRVVRREGLVCLKPFTNDLASWSKPPASAIEEDRRLQEESERTLKAFYASFSEHHS